MKCETCRKNEVMDTWWDTTSEWLMKKLFSKALMDFHQEKYTQGFSDGYVMGRKHEKEDNERIQRLYEGKD